MGPKNQRNSSTSASNSEHSISERLDDIPKILVCMVTKSDIDTKLLNLKETLKADIRAENRELIDSLKTRIGDLEEENDILREKVGDLENQVLVLQEKQTENDDKYNDLEQQGRKNSIRIYGLEDTDKKETVEECVEKIVNFVNS